MIDCKKDCPEYYKLLTVGPYLKPYTEPNMCTNWCRECVLEQLQKAESEVGRLEYGVKRQKNIVLAQIDERHVNEEEIRKLKDVHQKEITALVEQLEWYNGGDSFVIRRLKDENKKLRSMACDLTAESCYQCPRLYGFKDRDGQDNCANSDNHGVIDDCIVRDLCHPCWCEAMKGDDK